MGTLPCFRLMKSGIRSIGPGLYSAMMAMMSSKRSGLKPVSKSRMPELSSWKMPVVFPDESKAKVLASSKGNRSTLKRRLSGMAFINQDLGPADHGERLEAEKIEFH